MRREFNTSGNPNGLSSGENDGSLHTATDDHNQIRVWDPINLAGYEK
jgi:hypothetical protein